MYQFFRNNKKHFYTLFGVVIVCLICLFLEKKVYTNGLFIHRFLIYLLFIFAVFINLFFDYKKVWDFAFRKRYYIGIALLIFMVSMGYNTSSIGQYQNQIQPNKYSSEYDAFWNQSRSIRSDEFLANTPALLSQKVRKNFSSINNAIMARNTQVLLFPKVATLNISVLATPQLIGFLFLDAERGFSFYTLFPIFFCFFSVFELLLLITDGKKKISVVGTVLLVFSPSALWWNNHVYLGIGSLCVVLFNLFFNSKTKKQKLIYSSLLGLVGSEYIVLSYPAWQIPYGYMYLLLFIWIIIKNKNKIKPKDFLYAIIVLLIITIIVIPAYLGSKEALSLLFNTVYPGARNSVGGSNWKYLFLYMSSLLYGIRDVSNASLYSQYFSLYPIPILLGIIQCIINFKNKNNDKLLLFMTIYAIVLNIWNYISIGFLSKITLLYMSTPARTQLIVSVICIIIMIRLISRYEQKKMNYKRLYMALPLSLCTVLLCVKASCDVIPDYLTPLRTAFLAIVFFTIMVLLILNYSKTNKLFLYIMFILSIFVVITVNPLTKGISVINNKPFAKEVQKIVKKDKNAIWISANTSIYTSNYVLANGARVINSVNFYPNLDLWKKIDTENKYSNIYNRYAHIVINITDKKTHFYLNQGDYFTVFLNQNDICKLNTNYIATSDTGIDKYSNDKVKITKKYSEDNMSVFKVKCYNN